MAKSGLTAKACGYDGGGRLFLGFGFGAGRGSFQADEVEFSAVQKFPLHLIAGFQADGRSQSHGKAHIQSLILALGTNGLNPQRISGLHFV